MNSELHVVLQGEPEQSQQLVALQQAFAAVCNALTPMARSTRCWNRVALHHMAYRQLRAQYPQLGSQLVCNAIYSVSRACRQVYQPSTGPSGAARATDRPLPLLRFTPESPVYFDRHTLSLRDGEVSMHTLDGRMRFKVALSEADEQRFRDRKLREIVLRRQGEHFLLVFRFADGYSGASAPSLDSDLELPEYLLVTDPEAALGAGSQPAPAEPHKARA